MNYLFDTEDPFIIGLKNHVIKMSKELPDDIEQKAIPWNKGKTGVQTAWNKGIKTGPMKTETKEKLKSSLKGRKLSEEHKRNIGKSNAISKLGSIPWNKGRKNTKIK